MKDPGGFAHNPNYIMQILIDSLEVIGGDVSAMTRPAVEYSTPECGDATFPNPVGDFTGDCSVNLNDFAVFLDHWLEDTNP